MNKLIGYLAGKDSVKAPAMGALAAVYGGLGLFGVDIPGVPHMETQAAMQTLIIGLSTIFIAFRVKKSGPTQ